MMDSFFVHTFICERGFLIMQSLQLQTSAILWPFSDVITFTDVNLNDGIRDVLYNQSISQHIIFFYLTLGRITWIG